MSGRHLTLVKATGNAASFISDLEDSGSSAGYLGSGENFTLTSANITSLTSNKDIYPGTSIIRVPDGDDSKITYGSAQITPTMFIKVLMPRSGFYSLLILPTTGQLLQIYCL